MRHIHIIGIGAGDPEQLTFQAARAIAGSSVFFLFDKGEDKAQLTQLRTSLIEEHHRDGRYRLIWGESPQWSSRGPDYAGIVSQLNERKSQLTSDLIDTHLAPGETGALLVWGDPCLYDSSIRIVDGLASDATDLTYQVIPGISSIQALAARHRMPLNTISGAVEIMPARRLIADRLPPDVETFVVMLDAKGAFRDLADAGFDIFYGAYVGLPQERLFAGPLSALAGEIHDYRLAARQRHGWIMDSYILRRHP